MTNMLKYLAKNMALLVKIFWDLFQNQFLPILKLRKALVAGPLASLTNF